MGPSARRLGPARTLCALVAIAVLAGCTYSREEPGLFGRPTSQPSVETSTSESPAPLPASNPALPVAGDAVWISADGLGIEIRLAVHAVRRIDGGTVLDWSLTPLRAPNLRDGDHVPGSLELGLSRPPGRRAATILLVDPDGGAVYRPLVRPTAFETCLCNPLRLSPPSLRIGVTTLLQVAFPELPAGIDTVDVDIPTVPLFARVPVTPVGKASFAAAPTDLRRPAEALAVAGSTEMFRYGPDGQVFRLQVRRVMAGQHFTSLEWSIVAVTGGSGVGSATAPPFAGETSDGGNVAAASGPVLRYGDHAQTLRPRQITNRDISRVARECLCTDLRGWAEVLRRPDKVATVVTNFPGLPSGTREVTIAFAGLRPLDVPVTRVDPVSTSLPPVEVELRTWSRRSGPAAGWSPANWPTPVPNSSRFDRYKPTVDRLVR